MLGRAVSLSLHPTNKETAFGLAANAAKDPLTFDVATAVVLRFAKLGLESKKTLLGEIIKSCPLFIHQGAKDKDKRCMFSCSVKRQCI